MHRKVNRRTRILLGSLAAIAAAVACNSTPKPKARQTTTFYVVRHAEKVDQSADAPLSAAGRSRAEALRVRLEGVPLAAIYATSLRRTRQTVQPTATAHRLPVIATQVTAAELLHRHRGETVLIAGHSNTIPELLRNLGVATPVTISPQDYGDLFTVTVPVDPGDGEPVLQRSRFGAPLSPNGRIQHL